MQSKEDFSLEFEEAKQVQSVLVSNLFPEDSRFKIQTVYLPFTEVSGDLFSVQIKGKNELFVLFGDVSGHGVGSAIVGAMVVVSFRNAVRLHSTPKEVLEAIWKDLRPLIQTQFVSCVCAKFNFDSKKLTISSGGHPSVFVLRKGSEMGTLRTKGVPLFSIDGFPFEEAEVPYQGGDIFLFYSDGIYELESETGEYLGLPKFKEIVESEFKASQDISEFVFGVVSESLGHSDLRIKDDITILGLKII